MPAPLLQRMRSGTVQGTKHARLSINNQDAVMSMQFNVKSLNKQFSVGLVSDGSTGVPAFSRSEVGSNILVVFCAARIQEFILARVPLADIPARLYDSVTTFLRNFSNMIMPANIHWPYPIQFTGGHSFRNTQNATQRFIVDYLAATLRGFVSDGESTVVFRAGDGAQIIGDAVMVYDQDDRPDYPALSINSPSGGFDVQVYEATQFPRVALATDGIEKLLKLEELRLAEAVFTHRQGDILGLQRLLNDLRKSHPALVDDDATVLTLEIIEGES